MNKWLSMIIPVYNVEKYIRRCLDILCKQLTDDVEIILVDDQSPDNCPQICDEYSAKYENIIVIHKENGGAAVARNVGLDYASGEIIAFVDSDDCVTENYIEVIRGLYGKSKTAIFSVCIENENNEVLEKICITDGDEVETKEGVLSVDRIGGLNPLWNKTFDRSLIESEPKIRFLERSEPTEDLIFNCEYFSRNPKITLSDCCLYRYFRQRGIEDSLSHKFWPDLYPKTLGAIQAREEMYKVLGANSNDDIERLEKESLYYIYKCVPNMYRPGKKVDKKERMGFYKDILCNTDICRWVKKNKSKEKVILLFCFLYKLKSARLMDFIYNFLYTRHYK